MLWARGGYTPIMLVAKTVVLALLGRRGGTHGLDKANSAQYMERRAGMLGRPLVARIWLAAAIFDMAILYGIYVRFLAATGTAVICDRYTGDTRIDFERNFPDQFNASGPLWRLLERIAPRPALHFVLTVPVEVSRERSLLKDEPFPDDEATLTYRYERYCTLAEFNGPGRVRLDGTAPLDEVSEAVLVAVRGIARGGEVG